MTRTQRFHRFSLFTTLYMGMVWAAACDDDPADDAPEPREYFDGEVSAALGAANNQARCDTCHSDDGSVGRSGDSLVDIANKASYKGGDATTLLEAVNACVAGWMGGTPLTETDAEYQALADYLDDISDPSATDPNPLTPEVLADQAAYEIAYATGDAMAGAAEYSEHCSFCHDAGLVVGTSTPPPLAALASRPNGRIAQKVRTSGPPPSGMNDDADSTPGPMPFFEPDEISTSALANIIAYIRQG